MECTNNDRSKIHVHTCANISVTIPELLFCVFDVASHTHPYAYNVCCLNCELVTINTGLHFPGEKLLTMDDQAGS